MDTFLVPVGPARYELYSEQADAGLAVEGGIPPTGVLARARYRFAEMLLAAADRERAKREGRWQEPAAWWPRQRDRLTAWVAERVGEQKLYWSLRHANAAVMFHPSYLTADAALAIARQAFTHDKRTHGRWAAVHGVLFVVGGALAVLPGPNLVAYYFAFRMVGHWLSMRGAAQGLSRVQWTTRPSDELAEVSAVLDLPPAERQARLTDIAARLGLDDLPPFVERLRLGRA